jgi:hypothetical protein
MIVLASDVVTHLVFPLIILITGALLTGFGLPWLGRRRDDHRKAVELRVALVEELIQVVTRFVLAIEFVISREADRPPTAEGQNEYDEEYRSWEIGSAVISTKLEAYYPAPTNKEWDKFAGNVSECYKLSQVRGSQRRRRAMALLGHYQIGWPDIASGEGDTQDEAAWKEVWPHLKRAIFAEKREQIEVVLCRRLKALDSSWGRKPQ